MSYCGNFPGMCGQKADCADTHCPGRTAAREYDAWLTGVRAMRFCPGGESVEHGKTSTLCSFCSGGRCMAAQACEVPEEVSEATTFDSEPISLAALYAIGIAAIACFALAAYVGLPLSWPFN